MLHLKVERSMQVTWVILTWSLCFTGVTVCANILMKSSRWMSFGVTWSSPGGSEMGGLHDARRRGRETWKGWFQVTFVCFGISMARLHRAAYPHRGVSRAMWANLGHTWPMLGRRSGTFQFPEGFLGIFGAIPGLAWVTSRDV